MFRIRSIQVEHGDALLISYGENDQLKHLLIDGGPGESFDTLMSVLSTEPRDEGGKLRLKALLVTHYDLDHIEGAIQLLRAPPPWLSVEDVWFNGRRHLPRRDQLGPREGDAITTIIDGRFPWNAAFRDGAPQGTGAIKQACPPVTLDSGLEVHVLSPDAGQLSDLAEAWNSSAISTGEGSSCPTDRLGRSEAWPPDEFSSYKVDAVRADRSVANGSSIAVMLTFEGKRALLAADAFHDVIKCALATHLPPGEAVHLLKVSHHGSQGNTDLPLLNAIKCRKFLISSSGKNHKHPDHMLMARLLSRGGTPDIFFNYGVGWPGNWRSPPEGWPSYRAHFPRNGQRFIDVIL